MGLRDLGYKAYEGDRLPPSHNGWVLWRHGLRRVWGSWLVKIAAFTGWLPPVVAMGIMGFAYWLAGQMPPGAEAPEVPVIGVVRSLYDWQFWLFVTAVSMGAGASVVAEDRTFRAFQFYFAKPVTPMQYLIGRVAAVLLWCFVITFIPAFLLVLEATGMAPEELRVERIGLLLPALLYSLLIAVVAGVGSIGMSALSKSRALTMTAWIMLLILPTALGNIVYAISEWPWLLLGSIPHLLGVIGDSLFKVETESEIEWFHALPILSALVVGGLYLTYDRVRRAEVIT
ncbi:MAG: hypothetical protein AAGF12_29875 [Myxococcota bacterium]